MAMMKTTVNDIPTIAAVFGCLAIRHNPTKTSNEANSPIPCGKTEWIYHQKFPMGDNPSALRCTALRSLRISAQAVWKSRMTYGLVNAKERGIQDRAEISFIGVALSLVIKSWERSHVALSI